MSDLIRREDALRVTLAYSSSYSAEQAETAIRALPAVQPDADELVGHMTKLIAAGLDRVEQLTAERDKYEDAWMTAEGKLADAMEGLEKCQAELDEYSRQEYPLDHTVHERYRQRDYDANPARITLAALKGESHE